MFPSLPNDIVLDILSHVPKRHYPILSCVSKTFKILVRSPEIHKLRSLLGKDSLYICFDDRKTSTRNWFTLRRSPEKNPTDENLFISIDVPCLRNKKNYSSVIAVGPEIFFFSDRSFGFSSLSLSIFDSRSEKFRQGPSTQAEVVYSSTVGQVGCKIYVIGWDEKHDIRADFFDLKTQTWKQASIPERKKSFGWTSLKNNVAIDRKVCWLTWGTGVYYYNTRDDSLERFEFGNGQWSSNVLCVVDNVFYVYYKKLGLTWYDSKLSQWRIVNGLDRLKEIPHVVGMGEYYGKLAYMWTKPDGVVGSDKKQIWCRMIVLDRNEAGIHGTTEPCQLLGTVPRHYSVRHFLSLSD